METLEFGSVFKVPSLEVDPWLHMFLLDWDDMIDLLSRKKFAAAQKQIVLQRNSNLVLGGSPYSQVISNGTNAPCCASFRMEA